MLNWAVQAAILVLYRSIKMAAIQRDTRIIKNTVLINTYKFLSRYFFSLIAGLYRGVYLIGV